MLPKGTLFGKRNTKELKSHIDPHTLLVEDFNASLSPMERPSTQKLSRKFLELTDVIIQINLTGIYRLFNSITKEYAFSSALIELVQIDHIL